MRLEMRGDECAWWGVGVGFVKGFDCIEVWSWRGVGSGGSGVVVEGS